MTSVILVVVPLAGGHCAVALGTDGTTDLRHVCTSGPAPPAAPAPPPHWPPPPPPLCPPLPLEARGAMGIPVSTTPSPSTTCTHLTPPFSSVRSSPSVATGLPANKWLQHLAAMARARHENRSNL